MRQNAERVLINASLTGNPTAPTQAAANNSTRIATTAYVTRAITTSENSQPSLVSRGEAEAGTSNTVRMWSSLRVRQNALRILNNATLTGNPVAPTQAASNDSTRIATTAFVHDAIGSYTLVQTTNPTAGNITATPDGGSIIVRATTAYTPG